MSEAYLLAKDAQLAALEQAKMTGRRIYIYESVIGYTLADRAVSWAKYVGSVWPGGRMTWRNPTFEVDRGCVRAISGAVVEIAR